MRRPIWVLVTYAILLLAGIALSVPNFLPATMRAQLAAPLATSAVSLGLDLQGGAHLLLAVDRAALADHAARSLAEHGPRRCHRTGRRSKGSPANR